MLFKLVTQDVSLYDINLPHSRVYTTIYCFYQEFVMKDEAKTKKQLIEELGELRRKLSELNKLDSERRGPRRR